MAIDYKWQDMEQGYQLEGYYTVSKALTVAQYKTPVTEAKRIAQHEGRSDMTCRQFGCEV